MSGRETPTAKARRVWDTFAPRYDQTMRFCERVQFGGGREWVCSRARGETLEVAVGTGLNFACYPVSVTLTGVDLSAEMLAVARRRADELGCDVALREADAESLPFADASFDTVVCALSLCAIPDERAAIAEMGRVLRPGGRLLLLDHIASHIWPVWAAQWLLDQFTARAAGEHMLRRPLPLVRASGLVVEESERLKLGTVERVAAVKPAD